MREFLDAILEAISAASLTDDEYNTIGLESAGHDVETYNALLALLDSRELISSSRDRLTAYFVARGVSVVESSAAKSNIFVGSGL